MEHSEPIFHDRACVINNDVQTTDSSSLVPVTNATFTTKDLGAPANYIVGFSLHISSSLNNTMASFQMMLNGDPVGDPVDIIIRFADSDFGFLINECLVGIVVGDIVSMDWATDKGTLELDNFSLVADGLPEIRVV